MKIKFVAYDSLLPRALPLLPQLFWTTAVFLLAIALTAPRAGVALAQATLASHDGAASAADSQLQADALKALKNSRFKNVQVSVVNGVITLTGTVNIYADKEEADSKAHHIKAAAAIRNQIQVAGPTVSDAEIYKKLSDQIAWDRIGYGTTPFNAIDIQVKNGVVLMTGHAYGPVDKDSAVALAKYFKGVKDVIDEIEVDPVSSFDDQTRRAEYYSIYSYSALSKYGADPAKPIRITVINGTVILSGVVDNKTDKDLAYIRASSVPNVFKVINNLRVAGQAPSTEPTSSSSVSK